jgi:hypothetical protein
LIHGRFGVNQSVLQGVTAWSLDRALPSTRFCFFDGNQTMTESADQQYRTLHFLVRHGARAATLVALGALLFGLGATFAAGWPWAAPVVAAGALVLYVILRSYVEMVCVIVDMLLPK